MKNEEQVKKNTADNRIKEQKEWRGSSRRGAYGCGRNKNY